ncbi:MAG: glycine cleavage system protein H [Lentisphaerae bacterium]|jgi:glycine cleavage system H protein|nr:glycine cleavage system protein H [Lentisphaerota bacterium]
MIEDNDNRAYTARHVWVLPAETGRKAYVGMTDFLTEELQAIVGVDLPMVGDELDIDTFCIHLHIGSRIHHLRSPLTGRVLEINKDVLDNPSLLHLNPYKHWLYCMEYDDPGELDLLMSASQYQRHLDML